MSRALEDVYNCWSFSGFACSLHILQWLLKKKNFSTCEDRKVCWALFSKGYNLRLVSVNTWFLSMPKCLNYLFNRWFFALLVLRLPFGLIHIIARAWCQYYSYTSIENIVNMVSDANLNKACEKLIDLLEIFIWDASSWFKHTFFMLFLIPYIIPKHHYMFCLSGRAGQWYHHDISFLS